MRLRLLFRKPDNPRLLSGDATGINGSRIYGWQIEPVSGGRKYGNEGQKQCF